MRLVIIYICANVVADESSESSLIKFAGALPLPRARLEREWEGEKKQIVPHGSALADINGDCP